MKLTASATCTRATRTRATRRWAIWTRAVKEGGFGAMGLACVLSCGNGSDSSGSVTEDGISPEAGDASPGPGDNQSPSSAPNPGEMKPPAPSPAETPDDAPSTVSTDPTSVASDAGTGPTGVGPAPTDDSSAPDSGAPEPSDTPTDETPTDETPTDETPTDETPTDPPPEPSLIVSSEGNYWQLSEVVVLADGTPDFTVDSSTEYQRWYGFGGAFNEAGWDALLELNEAERQKALRLLFDEHEGIGLDWGRIPIGPSDYAVERYTLSDSPGHFSIERDRTYLIPYVKAAQEVKDDIKFWASPWTPPPWAKTGETEESGYDKGSFNSEYYQEYAEFFVAWIEAYQAQGIPIDSVMPQQQPGFIDNHPSSAFGPTHDSETQVSYQNPVLLGTFVDEYLFPNLDAAGLDTKVWFGTFANASFFEAYWSDLMSQPSAERIAGVGLQWGAQSYVNQLATSGYLIMQSEHKGGNYPFLHELATSPADADRNNFLPTMAPNNHAYGEESWDMITAWLGDGVHIYSAWNMVLDTYGWNLNTVRPWPQNAMLTVDRDAGELHATPCYYVFRHVAQYVDVGAMRVGMNGDALAFKNPDGSVVAIIRTTAAGTQTVSIDGTLLQYEASGNGWVTVIWQAQ